MRWPCWLILAALLLAPAAAQSGPPPDAAAAAAVRRDEAQRLARHGIRHPLEAADGKSEEDRLVSPSLANLALNATAIVRVTDLKQRGSRLTCKVTEAILGQTPDEIVVENKAIDSKLAAAHDDFDWILFLNTTSDGLTAYGAANNCGVPYSTTGLTPEDYTDYVLDSVTLGKLVRTLVGTRGAGDEATAAVVLELLNGETASERLAGVQLALERERPPGEAETAPRPGPPWPALPARIGATRALDLLLIDPPRTAANAAALLACAPPGTIFRKLGPIAEHEDKLSPSRESLAERSAALHAALAVVEAEFLARHAGEPAVASFLKDKSSFSGAAEPMKFLRHFWTLLFADDQALITALLQSHSPSDHASARRWLMALAGDDLGLGTSPDAAICEATVGRLKSFCEALKPP